MTLHDQLRAAGYTSRLPTDADLREHRGSSVYARAIIDAEGRCVAVLAAHEAWAWLRGER